MKKEPGVECSGSLTPALEAPHTTAHSPRVQSAPTAKGETP